MANANRTLIPRGENYHLPAGYAESGYTCKTHLERDVSLVVQCQQVVTADKEV